MNAELPNLNMDDAHGMAEQIKEYGHEALLQIAKDVD